MAIFKETVRSYTANLNPNRKQGGSMSIICDTAKLVVGFADPTDTIPANRYDAATKTGNGYQPFSSYPVYLELLRGGSPVSVTFNSDDAPPTFLISASQ